MNPHCETILNYNEDEKIISPVIKTHKKKWNRIFMVHIQLIQYF